MALFCYRAARCLAGVTGLAAASLCFATVGRAQLLPDAREVDIFCDEFRLGSLSLLDYSTYRSGEFGGAKVHAAFTRAEAGESHEFQWIQSIYAGHGTFGQISGGTLPYLDPYGAPMREDNLPWYWTESENGRVWTDGGVIGGANGSNGPGTLFHDVAMHPVTDDSYFIRFETAFVGVRGLEIEYLKGFTWGYEINADQTVSLFDFRWLDAPTEHLSRPVEAWDGTLNPRGGGPPVGYAFTDGCAAGICTPVPEASSGFVAAALIALLAAQLVRRRTAGCQRSV